VTLIFCIQIFHLNDCFKNNINASILKVDLLLLQEPAMTHPTDVDVLIVGAGPTGLTLACLLAQYGVKFKIIEKNKTITERSKALGVQARTLELFEQLGITENALNLGHPAMGLDLVVRGKLRLNIDLQTYGVGMTKYPYMLILEQRKTERLLWDKLKAYGGEISWQHELIDIKHHPDFVTATVCHFEKIETIRAKYLVAADGARSRARSLLQLPFEGDTYENRFMLADIALDWEFSREHITLCLSNKGFAGFFPMVGTQRYRAIGILPDKFPEDADQHFNEIAQDIQEQAGIPMKISNPEWISTYKIHHRNISKFRLQRCFFAGDAAHIHSPAGAQGMNTGIQDAFNLAWKLEMVLSGNAHDPLLDTYHQERFRFAKRLIRTTDRAFSLVTSRRWDLKFIRLYALPVILKFVTSIESLRCLIFKTVSQTGISYRKSKLSFQCFVRDSKFKAGDRFPEGMVMGEAIACECNDGLFHAFIVGSPQSQLAIARHLLKYFGCKIKIHTLAKRSDIHAILLAFGIHKDGIVLVRPDRYVAYCADELLEEHMTEYLDKFFIKRPEDEKRTNYDNLSDEEILSL